MIFHRWQGQMAIAAMGGTLLLSACQVFTPGLSSTQASLSGSPDSLQSKIDLTSRWIVSASEAQNLAQAGATLLDARTRRWPSIPEALAVTWQQFSHPHKPDRGKLKTDDTDLTQQLQSLGISSHKPVLVVGEPLGGWGEAGRIVWMLRSLGHQQAYMVDGGAQALTSLNQPSKKSLKGDFIVQRNSRWSIEKETLKQQLQAGTLKIIDSREPREFAGKTPYGELRGGHLDSAQNLYFKDFLDGNGMLLSHPVLVAKLENLGLTPEDSIVVYCTGGIRSGWLTTVLVSLGYQAQNYAGSMWEWSASPAIDYPLITSAR